jgi:hypothetical protein
MKERQKEKVPQYEPKDAEPDEVLGKDGMSMTG